jgi:hypothetical protein
VVAQQHEVYGARGERERDHPADESQHHLDGHLQDVDRAAPTEAQRTRGLERDAVRASEAHRHEACVLDGRDRREHRRAE